MPANNEKRKTRYKKLVEAGFTGKEATRYKDRNDEVVDKLILEKKRQKERLEEISRGGRNNG